MTNDFIKEWAKTSKQAQLELASQYIQQGINPYVSLTKEELMRWGIDLWPISYQSTDDDFTAFDKIVRHMLINMPDMAATMGLPDNQILISWCARWADCGFPQINIGHKITSALMSTSVSKELLADIKPPWEAFLINIPDNILFTNDPRHNKQICLTQLSIQRTYRQHENRHVWNWRLFSNESAINLWQVGVPPEKMIESDIPDIFEGDKEIFDMIPDESDDRIAQIINRFIASFCLTFPEHNKSIGVGSKLNHDKKGYLYDNDKKIPITRTYELRAPITIDCRDNIKNYIQHGNCKHSSPIVQSIVRGFLRRPPYGIQKGLPKTVWVHPHLRGPKDGPIVVRAHNIKEK